jgi:hypothetical protein
MTDVRVIGVDPGPTPGMVLLRFNPGPFAVAHVVQCTHLVAPTLFEALLEIDPTTPTIVGTERFVIGRRSARSKSAKAGEVTRDLIGRLQEVWEAHDSTEQGRLGGRWFLRSAVQVKAWATDERLDAIGLLEATKGMTHAKDAARHALYAAVHDGKIPDPLSKRARQPLEET